MLSFEDDCTVPLVSVLGSSLPALEAAFPRTRERLLFLGLARGDVHDGLGELVGVAGAFCAQSKHLTSPLLSPNEVIKVFDISRVISTDPPGVLAAFLTAFIAAALS